MEVSDPQQYPLYDSEYDVFGCAGRDVLNEIPGRSLAKTEGFINEVTHDKSLLDAFYIEDPFWVEVKDSKKHWGEANHISRTIWLPKPTRTTWYALHELAHIVDAKR